MHDPIWLNTWQNVSFLKLKLYSNSNWYVCFRFINARRRIVQPMIDQSNRAGKTSSILSTNPCYTNTETCCYTDTQTCYTEDAYNFMSPEMLLDMHHGYVYPAYHEGYTPGYTPYQWRRSMCCNEGILPRTIWPIRFWLLVELRSFH